MPKAYGTHYGALVKIDKITKSHDYEVRWDNGKLIGWFQRDPDGYYLYRNDGHELTWSAGMLLALGEKLRDLNTHGDGLTTNQAKQKGNCRK